MVGWLMSLSVDRLLKEAADDVRYRKRFQLLFGALLSVVGKSMRNELSKQDKFVHILSSVADKVKASKDREVQFLLCVFYMLITGKMMKVD